jgi:SnoaL-like domain
VTELEDRLAIIELIGRLSLAIDAKDWDAMGQLFTDTVYHDRTSLTGGKPYTAPARPEGSRVSRAQLRVPTSRTCLSRQVACPAPMLPLPGCHPRAGRLVFLWHARVPSR